MEWLMSIFSEVVYDAITNGRQRGRMKVLKKMISATNWSDWLPDEFLSILAAVTIYVALYHNSTTDEVDGKHASLNDIRKR